MKRFKRVKISNQLPEERVNNFDEVCLGYTLDEAVEEANRCIQCKNPKCVSMCPVGIDIPKFIDYLARKDLKSSFKVLSEYTSLPAICGRVCPQEEQCEMTCVLGARGDSIAIGKLERFVADWARKNNYKLDEKVEKNNKKVAVVGSGPAGITCAGELNKLGYDVTIYEALHKPGGVLVYGIPDFRLPSEEVVEYEINTLVENGVDIVTNCIIGQTKSIEDLFEEYEAIFIGSGAGLPNFLNIKGINLNGVFSANEFLTRNNLMLAYREDYDTPIQIGNKVGVIGGGNVAMDAARTAKRLGADVDIIYRRTLEDMPAREEEVEHAIEEGINMKCLTNIKEIKGNEKGFVSSVICERMEVTGKAGNKSNISSIEGSDFEKTYDSIIFAIGTKPNPLITNSNKEIKINEYSCIEVDDKESTSMTGVFAGGDIVTGAATVIEAMGSGKRAAKGIDDYIKNKGDLN